ncbi:hypothetical protein BGX27_006687 [Mortierella sp. AM989]|nr:hypothetical protein BGX27_006687 [Mortierella sp. AM989]
MSSLHRSISTNPNTSTIQPTVKTILDLARRSDQHIVRLYYLPTPNTNGFATTHTLVSTYTDDKYPRTPPTTSANFTTRNRSISLPTGHNISRNDQDTSSSNECPRRTLHLTRVSESDRGIVHLARLRISTMIIATSSLPYLAHLVSLRLQGNRLTDLPLEIFRLPSLRELDVSQNLLTELSGLIGLLAPTLEELFLQSNRLQSLPQQIGLLKRLRLLDIADNHLGCIPVEIQRLVSESLISERRSLWRVNETGLSLSNILDETWTQGEVSNNTPQTPIEHLQPDATPVHGNHNSGILNEEGGHDDDDYVQIRQGMKCWARGNRFWQVKASRTSAPLSPITATATMLLAGPASSTSSSTTTSPSTPASPPLQGAEHSGTLVLALPRLPSSSVGQHPLFSESGINASDRRDFFNESIPHHQHMQHQHRRDVFRYHHPSHRQYPYHQQHTGQQPHPEHLVDRRGYSKDSYTSCSWTLSLADICSQIVGEKLYDDPHYFCHTNTCPYKKRRKENFTTNSEPTIGPSESQLEGCTMMMMPEWMTEQLGLHHLSELRKAYRSSGDSDLEEDDDRDASVAGDTDYESLSSEIDLFNVKGKSDLLEIPAPMHLTLKEKEMECEFCSVCQKRLYYAGMRWKGVGVMDERIVPLEWVACSVQCRTRAERGERRDQGKASSAEPLGRRGEGEGEGGGGGSSSLSSSSTVSQDGVSRSDSCDNCGEGEEGEERASHGCLPEGFQNGVNTNVNHESLIFSAAHSPGLPLSSQGVSSGSTGSGTEASLGCSSLSIVTGGGETEETLARQPQQQQQQQQQQRDYRETLLYGLIKSRALRRRTRSLSL